MFVRTNINWVSSAPRDDLGVIFYRVMFPVLREIVCALRCRSSLCVSAPFQSL